VAFAFFASALQLSQRKFGMGNSWRPIFVLSAVMQFVPFILLVLFGKPRGNQSSYQQISKVDRNRTRKPSLLRVLLKQAKTTDFWLHFTSRSALMVFGSFLLFIPSFMSHCYDMDAASSARVGSGFALGCLLAVSTLSTYYSSLDRTMFQKRTFLLLLLLLSTLCAASQLAHVLGCITLTAPIGSFLMFLWGFSFSIPFYIPPSLFALEKGGKISSATIADIFDVGGFTLLALFNRYVTRIDHTVKAAWGVTFSILTACSITSSIALGIVTRDKPLQDNVPK